MILLICPLLRPILRVVIVAVVVVVVAAVVEIVVLVAAVVVLCNRRRIPRRHLSCRRCRCRPECVTLVIVFVGGVVIVVAVIHPNIRPN